MIPVNTRVKIVNCSPDSEEFGLCNGMEGRVVGHDGPRSVPCVLFRGWKGGHNWNLQEWEAIMKGVDGSFIDIEERELEIIGEI